MYVTTNFIWWKYKTSK